MTTPVLRALNTASMMKPKAYTAPLKLPVSKSFRIQARALDHFDNTSETVMSLERIKVKPKKSEDRDTGLLNRLFENKSKD